MAMALGVTEVKSYCPCEKGLNVVYTTHKYHYQNSKESITIYIKFYSSFDVLLHINSSIVKVEELIKIVVIIHSFCAIYVIKSIIHSLYVIKNIIMEKNSSLQIMWKQK